MQFLCNAVGWLGFGWFPSRKIAIASDRRLASSATSYYLLASYSILLTVLAYQLRLFCSLPIHTKYIVKLPLAPFNHVHIDVCCGPCCEGMERIDIYSGKNHHLHVNVPTYHYVLLIWSIAMLCSILQRQFGYCIYAAGGQYQLEALPTFTIIEENHRANKDSA